MDRFEELLRERDIEVVGQAATGSGDMVLLQLRLVDGIEVVVALSLSVMVETPYEALTQVETAISERRDEADRRGNGGGNR